MKILSHQLKTSEYARNIWVANALELGVTKDDFLKSDTYIHVLRSMNRGDRIEVLAPDGSWYAEYIVRAKSEVALSVGLLQYSEFNDAASPSAEEYEVKFCGPIAKWRVTRLSDKTVLKDGFMNKAAAQAWLAGPDLEQAA